MEAIVTNADVTLGFERETGFATLTMAAHAVNAGFIAALEAAVAPLKGLTGLAGVLVEAAPGPAGRPWCVGADLDALWPVRDPAALKGLVTRLHKALRALETCGAPVVAVLDGAAVRGSSST